MASNLFRDETKCIYNTLSQEYKEKYLTYKYNFWFLFIKEKDLGIIPTMSTTRYKIIDESKWLLTKLKYGF